MVPWMRPRANLSGGGGHDLDDATHDQRESRTLKNDGQIATRYKLPRSSPDSSDWYLYKCLENSCSRTQADTQVNDARLLNAFLPRHRTGHN